MDEADVLAEMFGRKPQPEAAETTMVSLTPAAPPSPAPPPLSRTPRDYGLVVGGLVLAAFWVVLSAWGINWAVGNGWLALGDAGIDAVANLIVFGGLIGVALLFARLQPLPAPGRVMSTAPALALGLGLGLAGLLASLLQGWAGGHVVAAKAAGGGGIALLLLGTVMILFQTVAEELLFRGWLQTRLTRLAGPTGAVAIAALAFSLLHIFGGARSVIALANIFIAGLFFGLLMLRTGTVWAPIAAHFGWNWAETIVFGLAPNPGAPVYGAILDFDLDGASYWGGSDQGLNAAYAVTIALTALILPLLAWHRGETQPQLQR